MTFYFGIADYFEIVRSTLLKWFTWFYSNLFLNSDGGIGGMVLTYTNSLTPAPIQDQLYIIVLLLPMTF